MTISNDSPPSGTCHIDFCAKGGKEFILPVKQKIFQEPRGQWERQTKCKSGKAAWGQIQVALMNQICLRKLIAFWLTAIIPVTFTRILITSFRTFISVYIFEPY